MSIQDNIKVQQAFVKARLEYESKEQERQQKIKEKAHEALLVRQKQAEERNAEHERIKSDPDRMKKMEGYAFEVSKPKYNL